MITYEMEELLPVVAELSRKYTAGESTSLSYEKAQQLMEAVIYCIREVNSENSMLAEETYAAVNNLSKINSRVSAAEGYRAGKKAVLHKVKLTQEKYNRLMMTFCDYGNENLRDTVTGAIPGFFKYYDPAFAPQNTIITMDYPVLNRDTALQGIDAVAAYLDAICVEQLFLGRIRTEFVCSILQEVHEDYKRQFFNISSVVMRHILMDMLIGKSIERPAEQEDYHHVWKVVRENDSSELQRMLTEQLRILVQKQYADNEQIMCYFECDIRDLAVQLKNLADMAYLRNVVIL